MKGTLKRVMSGVLSVITIASAVAQPMTAYAVEPEKAASSFEAQYPELEAVKDKLAEDEILTANDYSIDYGSDFDIKVDFSGIEGINDAKVKVELYEAKNEAGDDFDTYQADTYKAVYKVEPVSGNPSYRISRNVTVKEPETEQLTEPNTSENTAGEGNAGETEDSGNAEEDADAEGQTEIVTDLTEEVTTDEESGLTVSEVMDQAADPHQSASDADTILPFQKSFPLIHRNTSSHEVLSLDSRYYTSHLPFSSFLSQKNNHNQVPDLPGIPLLCFRCHKPHILTDIQ